MSVNFRFVITILIFGLTSCETKDLTGNELCNSPECLNYYSIWISLIQNNSGLSKEYLDRHVDVKKTEIHRWDKGESFRVSYTFRVDWFVSEVVADQFIIKIDGSDDLYPDFPYPRGQYLEEEMIELITENNQYGANIHRLKKIQKLAFSSKGEALDFLRMSLNNREILSDKVSSVIRSKIEAIPELSLILANNRSANRCDAISLDLVTKKISEREISCKLSRN